MTEPKKYIEIETLAESFKSDIDPAYREILPNILNSLKQLGLEELKELREFIEDIKKNK